MNHSDISNEKNRTPKNAGKYAGAKKTKVSSFMADVKEVWKWMYRFRSILLAVPVALVALRLALFNSLNLPETVGIDLQANGQYTSHLSRNTVVLWPLILTGGCLVMMFCSRKVIYPWIISVFSLLVPVLIYITNIFPA